MQCNNSSWCYLSMLLSMPQACWGLYRKLFSNLQFYKIIPNWGWQDKKWSTYLIIFDISIKILHWGCWYFIGATINHLLISILELGSNINGFKPTIICPCSIAMQSLVTTIIYLVTSMIIYSHWVQMMISRRRFIMMLWLTFRILTLKMSMSEEYSEFPIVVYSGHVMNSLNRN